MSDACIPPEVLTSPDLQHALAEHDFAEAFRLIKRYAGLSQNRIANACGLTPGKVSTIISGSTQVTSYEVLVRIADGLHIPGCMLGLAPDRGSSSKTPPLQRPNRPRLPRPTTRGRPRQRSNSPTSSPGTI